MNGTHGGNMTCFDDKEIASNNSVVIPGRRGLSAEAHSAKAENDGGVWRRASAFPRRHLRPGFASSVSLSKEEGAGNAGRWPHPQASWAEKEKCPQV
jgi:hypothetical protein